MSENYVKKYDVGEIRLDLPYANYIHELPLLSFGDVLHTVNLNLVFNYANRNDNSFHIAPGYKLNLQKRIIKNTSTNIPEKFQDEYGKWIDLTYIDDITFTFQDDSQRILRKIPTTNSFPSIPGSDIEMGDGNTVIVNYYVEYPDGSKEKYNENGYLMAVYDKYSDEPFLTYTYYSAGRLASITYKNKTINFVYEENKLKSITYDGKSTTITYIGHHLTVAHYSGVDFNYSVTNDVFSIYSANAGQGSSDTCSRRWMCNKTTNSITIQKLVGGKTIDQNTYEFLNFNEATNKCNLVDVTDKFNVKTRIQLEDENPICSYEVDSDFLTPTNIANSRYPKTVFLYDKNDVVGSQSEHEGTDINLTMIDYDYARFNLDSSESASGCFILSGWMNVGAGENCTFTIRRTNPSVDEYCSVHNVPVIRNQEWQYFSFGFNIQFANTITVSANAPTPKVYLKDLRLTFQSGTIASRTHLTTLAKVEDVLIYEGETDMIIPFNKCQFYIGNTPLNQKVTSGDILKYKINQNYNRHSAEIYYNDCRGIITSIDTFNIQYEEGILVHTIPVSNLAVGKIVYKNGKEYITKTNFYPYGDNNTPHLMTKSAVNNSYYKEDVYDSNFDLICSTVDGVTTNYERNAQGLVTKEETLGLYIYKTVYGDNEITVSAVREVGDDESDELIEQTLSKTKYYINPVWGYVDKVEALDGSDNVISVVDNTYDSESTLTGVTFGSNSPRSNTLNYSNGYISELANGNLRYKMFYDSEYLTAIKKYDPNSTADDPYNSVEHHTHSKNESDNTTTVVSKYPSATNPLYSTTTAFDKYERLVSVKDTLSIVYDIWPSFNSDTGEIETSTDNNLSLLAMSTDLLRNEKSRYIYNTKNALIEKTVTDKDNFSDKISKETFGYDDIGRLTSDHCIYNQLANSSVTSEIEYATNVDSPVADNRVGTYTYKVNGSTKLQTYNTFDPYKRITEKKYKFNTDYFIKDIEYDHTRVSRIIDKKDVLSNDDIVLSDISYEYDALGRIIREKNIDENGNETVIKSYTYDEYGQLIREDNLPLDKTFQYVYNEIGNILYVHKYPYTPKGTEPSGDPTTTSFTYNSSKPDVLSKLGNTSIGFNRNGALSSYIRNYTWSNGKLSKFMRGSKMMPGGIYEECNYSYNGYGQRVSKTYAYDPNPAVSSDASFNYTKTYTYDHSGRLINEKIVEAHNLNGNSTREIVYLYDECGMVGFTYSLNGATPTSYYYQRNLLGDVVAIYNTNGAKVVEYAYDAWGNCTIVYSSNDTLANDNPIRYRGYYFDIENNFYYLNARYYSPEFRRFISPDDTSYLDPENVNGLNLYCYCGNDPVNYKQRPVSYGGSIISSSISVGGSSVPPGGSYSGGNLGGAGKSSTPWWISTAVGAIPDFILGMRYLAASGMHSKFAYVTNTRYMHPIMGGTWRWFGKSSSSFGTVAQGTFQQILTGDARAGFGAIAKSVGVNAGLNALVNFGFNLYENNWQVDSAMLIDTAIDTAIGMSSYGLASGTMSLATAGLLVTGVTLPGAIVIGGVVILSIGFEHLIRALSGYWD